ncbi:Adenylate cyclase [Astathelohania contejeani]|uniref:Adenylate cyclase n=1 Tax=Astathelohania contejeani TaxID=164912 RepID=A0ABQ7HYF6_9MICR|nr:Adenylate cyclase [Thelohania contejeani]
MNSASLGKAIAAFSDRHALLKKKTNILTDNLTKYIYKNEITIEFNEFLFKNLHGYSSIPTYSEKVLVFTDIVNSSSMWNFNEKDMRKSLRLHDECVYNLMKDCDGRIITNEGDAFLIAFENSFSAISFSIKLHLSLERIKWPRGILMHNSCLKLKFNGLRVRQVVTYGFLEKFVTLHGNEFYGGYHLDKIKKLSDKIRHIDLYICKCVNLAPADDKDIFEYINQKGNGINISYQK